MNWNPSLDFRLDLGYVNSQDFEGDIHQLPHCDLTHLKMWGECLMTEKNNEEPLRQQLLDRIVPIAYIVWAMAPGVKAIGDDFVHNLDVKVQAALNKLKAATQEYVKFYGDTPESIMAQEQQLRFKSGAIIIHDITKDNVTEVEKSYPKADYKGRVQWILKNLESVKEGFKEDYSYWQGILKLVGG